MHAYTHTDTQTDRYTDTQTHIHDIHNIRYIQTYGHTYNTHIYIYSACKYALHIYFHTVPNIIPSTCMSLLDEGRDGYAIGVVFCLDTYI